MNIKKIAISIMVSAMLTIGLATVSSSNNLFGNITAGDYAFNKSQSSS